MNGEKDMSKLYAVIESNKQQNRSINNMAGSGIQKIIICPTRAISFSSGPLLQISLHSPGKYLCTYSPDGLAQEADS